MEFSSIIFIFFFLPFSVLICNVLPLRFKNISLLFLSMIFLFARGIYAVFYLAGFSLINYVLLYMTGKYKNHNAVRRLLLFVSVLFDIVFVFICRYGEWFNCPPNKTWSSQLVFIGASFCTLSALGTIFEISRGNLKEELSFLKFTLYLTYFPKITMGPYISYDNFFMELKKSDKSLTSYGTGVSVFVKGLAKKVIIADSLYRLWTAVNMYDPEEISVLTSWLGVLAYSFGIYFTLSGITDMAVGVSEMLGIVLPFSFNYPSLSMGMKEFSKRWHTTLTKWFSDYIYSPLQRKEKIANCFVFILIWGVIGLFYELSLNKFLWGLIIGTASFAESKINKNFYNQLSAFLYAFIVTSVGWVFFMESSIMDSFKYLKAMLGGTGNIADSSGIYFLKSYIVILLIAIYASTDLFKNLLEKLKHRKRIDVIVNIVSPVISAALFLTSAALIISNGESQQMIIRF